MKQERIGFIGLGLMGKEMARHIVRNGYPLTVMAHRNRSPLKRYARKARRKLALPQRWQEIAILFLSA